MKIVRNMLVVCAALVVASAAMAQGGGRGQGGMRMMGGAGDSSGMMLLQRKDVQADLAITDDQKSKLEAARTKMQDEMRAQFQNGGGGGDREAMMKVITKMQEDMKKETEKVLTKEQMARLRQINIQLAGTNAANWADVQKEIGMTEDQVKKIKDLQAKQQEANQGLFQKMRDQEMTREELQDAMKKNGETLKSEMAKILTSEQKDKLKAMGGKEFKADKDGGR
jgi:Spy/CpxP family protein refolding chaperone